MLTSITDYLVSPFAARPREQDFTAIAVPPLAKYYDEMRVLTMLEKSWNENVNYHNKDKTK